MKGVARVDHQIGVLARLQRTDPVGHAAMRALWMVIAARASPSSMPCLTAAAAQSMRYFSGVSGWSVVMAQGSPARHSSAGAAGVMPCSSGCSGRSDTGGDHLRPLLPEQVGHQMGLGAVDQNVGEVKFLGDAAWR